ncbi:hypothetical protein [Mycoplasmopsis alligatoris]|uniref:Uncharacterized protein n=1 Tax=Mycoplasmopsis alligatoris A21JP2 TaxID=747682 RepID=D4XV21_9BACT|nr:hypothetical protein [Mycoplasmopsis alligatoris]EFF41848.1 hypothetical protein MALL_0180 [Mycoplasmopsis alligatoris A21JP2]
MDLLSKKDDELLIIFGHEKEGKKTLLFERLNLNAYNEGYTLNDQSYLNIKKLVVEYKLLLETVNNSNFEKDTIEKENNNINTFKLKLENNETKNILNNIYDSNEFLTTFKNSLNNVLTKLTAWKNKDKNSKEINELKTTLKNELDNLGFENTGFKKSVIGEILSYIEDSNTNKDGYNRKKTQITKLSKIVPGQELFALIRYWVYSESANLSTILIADDHDDKDAYKLLTESYEKLRSKNNLYRNINDINPSFITHADPKDESDTTPIFNKIKELESKYAQASLDALKTFKDPKSTEDQKTKAKNALSTARNAFYKELNSKDILIERNSEIRHSSTKYKNYEDMNEQGYQPFHLAQLYAELVSLSEIMKWLNNNFIK